MLTIVVTCWAGPSPVFSPWHVRNLRNQFGRHLTIPHRFVCLTDDVVTMAAAGIDARLLVQPTVQLTTTDRTFAKWKDSYARVGLATPGIGGMIGDWLLSADLDMVIRANIDDVVERARHHAACFFDDGKLLPGFLWSVRPGELVPNPWIRLHNDSTLREKLAKIGGTDTALFTHLYRADVKAGALPSWSEADGITSNRKCHGWRVLSPPGSPRPWETAAPERAAYLDNSRAI